MKYFFIDPIRSGHLDEFFKLSVFFKKALEPTIRNYFAGHIEAHGSGVDTLGLALVFIQSGTFAIL